MSLIKLKLDINDTVTASGWANPDTRNIGDVTADGFTIYDINQDEIDALVVNYTKLIGNHLVVDSDYVPPVETPTEPQPSEQDKINAQLMLTDAKNKKDQDILNAQILLQIAKGAN